MGDQEVDDDDDGAERLRTSQGWLRAMRGERNILGICRGHYHCKTRR